MKFQLKGKPVFAECTLDVAAGDALMQGFQAAQPGVRDPHINFFEVYDFDFDKSIKEGDVKETPAAGLGSGPFARWRSAITPEYKKIKYKMEFDKFSFKRTVDRASPIFFASCCSSTTFDSATLVKRLAQGGDRAPAGILRIDFEKVLLTGIDWSDDDLIKESCDFICQKVTITLRQQQTDGTISGAQEYVMTWDPPLLQKS
jgi:type VI protein secretion system component Hcp